ncbi:hypothetical protein I79_000017 [Cricetulus griseus]|uniref:Uncharacterized protein n=1 Tax=Cricetulus griseus TaxID=10029 RepID=G3GR74_CRIGR|nr:hypothetical protein I79_000017 [Cricetulus griseus]
MLLQRVPFSSWPFVLRSLPIFSSQTRASRRRAPGSPASQAGSKLCNNPGAGNASPL